MSKHVVQIDCRCCRLAQTKRWLDGKVRVKGHYGTAKLYPRGIVEYLRLKYQ